MQEGETNPKSPTNNKQVTDEELLNVLRRADEPFLETPAIIKEVEIGDRGVLKRLKQLQEEGRLETKTIGPTLV